MDLHFRTSPSERNLPVLMGLLAVWSLTLEAPGQLIALYEHSAFKQALIWNIDSFDQHMDPALPPSAGRAVMSLDWK